MLQDAWRLFACLTCVRCCVEDVHVDVPSGIGLSRELCLTIEANKGKVNMSGIVCAIRGGPGCQSTVAYAIALARQTGIPLHFLYVVNRDLLERAGGSYAHSISERMHEMGKAVLGAAHARATAQGATARGVMRHGSVGDEIVSLCRDLGADYVVLGGPNGQQAGSIFTEGLLRRLSEQVKREAGSQVFLIKHGDTQTVGTVGCSAGPTRRRGV
jgi:nucleotide-binding universal stress UspA family protein